MIIEHIKPIPKYMEKKIRAIDRKKCPEQKGLRFYSYLTKLDSELVKITVAMRNKTKKQVLIKQVAVHGVDSDKCFVKDMEYNYLGIYAYRVGWYDEGVYYQMGRPFYNDGKWYECDFKYYNPYATVMNPEYALKQTKYRYSAIDIFRPACPIAYLKLYTKYPQLEYLVKLGYRRLAMSKLILEKAGKDKNFRKWLAKNRQKLSGYTDYYVQTVLRAYSKGVNLDLEQRRAELVKKYRNGDFKTFMRRFSETYKTRLFDYIAEQDTNLHSYIDYFNACEHLKLDMNDTKNRFPLDFKRWHDIRTDEYKTARALEDAEKKKVFYSQFAEVANKFISLERNKNEGFVVIIAKSPMDLFNEGKALSHCVGSMNYDQKFVRQESLIFFIRPKEDTQTPYVTMEYSLEKKKILQCYGYKDKKPEQEVLDFVNNKWLPYANRKMKALVA